MLDDTGEYPKILPHVEVQKSKRAKRLALRVDTQKRVVNLVIPKGMSFKKAQEFAYDHENWICEQIRRFPKIVAFKHGAVLPIWGKKRVLVINYDPDYEYTDIQLLATRLVVWTNRPDPTNRIERFLREEAHKTISELAHKKAKKIGKKIKSIQLRDTKSRWGRCGPDRKISFTWRLIFAPYAAMDYVVAHEIAHLKHLDHSPRFWALCEKLCEDYKKGKDWMHTQGQALMGYGIRL